LENLSRVCENKMVDMVEKLDTKLLLKIYNILKKYKDIFYFSDPFFRKIEEVLLNKTNTDECILLNPCIDDLFDNNLYKLTIHGQVYIIPLWHHELVYENGECDLIIKCYPILPENIQMDENNNLIVEIHLGPIQRVLEKETVTIDIGKRTFELNTSDLKISKRQIMVLKNQGISLINKTNIYDISRKSNIILKIHLDSFF